ncbi:acyltransferase family protein, partial [Escherichia coli]|nr:acyltransferase family protein [Escherichia coli]
MSQVISVEPREPSQGFGAPGRTASGHQRNFVLDAMRALAVLLVIAYHVAPASVPAGYLGVDLFFVLSGYLITSSLLR